MNDGIHEAIIMEIAQPKFRGLCVETNQWQYGHGWFKCDYTEEYKREKGIDDRAMLYTESHPIECYLLSMGRFANTVKFADTTVDLYEGDIVADITDIGMHKRYQIVWDESGGMFLYAPLFETDSGALDYYEMEEIYGDNLYPVDTVFKKPDTSLQP